MKHAWNDWEYKDKGLLLNFKYYILKIWNNNPKSIVVHVRYRIVFRSGSVLVYDFWTPPTLLLILYMICNRYLGSFKKYFAEC